jgi:hypothetical protein
MKLEGFEEYQVPSPESEARATKPERVAPELCLETINEEGSPVRVSMFRGPPRRALLSREPRLEQPPVDSSPVKEPVVPKTVFEIPPDLEPMFENLPVETLPLVDSAAGAPLDPISLKHKSYQARIGQELLDFLVRNNFQLETKHRLRSNALKSPAQKDFTSMFQWLYQRIEPGYRFQKSVEAEVQPILKRLGYPYQKHITKSQITSAGSQTSWPSFLGMLYWMMQLAEDPKLLTKSVPVREWSLTESRSQDSTMQEPVTEESQILKPLGQEAVIEQPLRRKPAIFGPPMSKSPDTESPLQCLPPPQASPEREPLAPKRRAGRGTRVSYVEPSLKKKMRRSDIYANAVKT